MKTLRELGFSKEWEHDNRYVWRSYDYRGGSLAIYFYTDRQTWDTNGWVGMGSEIALAILLECIQLGWISFEGGI